MWKGTLCTVRLAAKVGELIAAMVENLEAHQETLDITDENGNLELRAYVKLSQEFRCTATQLQETAAHMAGYSDLPMARHNPAKMAVPKFADAFTNLVEARKRSAHVAMPVDQAGSSALSHDDRSSRVGPLA